MKLFSAKQQNKLKHLIKKFFSPTRSIMSSFLIVIIIGAILLWLPFSNNSQTDFIDALFTATSAVCVTGLSPVTTAEHWNTLGKIIIILLIQIGGLGTMTMLTLTMFIFNKKITFKDRLVLQEATGKNATGGVVRLIKSTINTSLLVELAGAILLSFKFIPEYDFINGIGYSLFHSISAFCNAGFDLIGGSSFIPYAGSPLINITLMLLITLGGLGFTVWFDLLKNRQEKLDIFKSFANLKNNLMRIRKKGIKIKFNGLKNCFQKIFIDIKKLPSNANTFYLKLRKYAFSLTLQTKLVLIISFILIFSGALSFFVFEYSNPNTLAPLTLSQKIYTSLFQSVSARTAGFYSIDLSKMTYGSKIVYSILMFIGGSPGGTAGGMKTITIAIIILTVFSVVKGKEKILIFNRKIPFIALQKSLTIVILGIILIIVSLITLTFTEKSVDCEFVDLYFEVVSALSTTGSSLSLTPKLTTAGKAIICVLMYIGRLGPMTVALALTNRNKETNNNIDYPSEDNIMVG